MAASTSKRATEAPSQSRDHADVDGIRLSDFGQRLARGAALERFLALIVRRLWLAAELHTVGHGALAAFPGTLTDEIALKFGNRGQQRREQPAVR